MGDKDDPRFLEFIKTLEAMYAEGADETADIEPLTLEEYLAEAERRYWAHRGDPAEERERLIAEARRRLKRQRGKNTGQ